MASDATVTIDAATVAAAADAVPQTSDSIPGLLYFAVGFLIFAGIGIMAVVVTKHNQKKENGK